MIAGVCGGLGRRLGVDPVILRVVVVVLAFFAGAGLVLYASAWLLMPVDRTNQSLLADALGSGSPNRVQSVLTAGALLVVASIAALFALDGGFVPGLLIAVVVVAILLVVRRHENAAATGRPGYVDPPAFPPGPAAPPSGAPTYGGPTYGAAQYQTPAYGSTESPRASASPSTYPTTSAATGPTADTGNEPTLVTDPNAEPTLVTPPWQPPSDPPPPPSYLSQQGPPPGPRRERSYLGVLTVSAVIAAVGVMGIVDVSGVAVPLAGYFVAALAVVAGGLVLGAWLGRSRGLIALGVLLGLALGPAVLVDAVAGTEWRDWSNADNIRLAPQTADELAPSYDYGAGSVRMDLTGLDFEDEQLDTMIDMGAGEVIVTVPADVDVVVDGAAVMGDLTLFDRRTSGFDTSDAFTDLGADGVGGGQLDLSIDLGLGKVEVRRATS